MIASIEKDEDQKTYCDVLDILETSVRWYMGNPDPEILIHIDRLNEWADELRVKIESGDYTEADKRRQRIDSLLAKSNNYGM